MSAAQTNKASQQQAPTVTLNARASTAAEILGQAFTAAPLAAQAAAVQAVTTLKSSFTPERGNYWLSVLFYLLIYVFGIFLLAVFVHYTITPVFVFQPGKKGLVTVPGTQDDMVFWNNKTQPPARDVAPPHGSKLDDIDGTKFTKNYSFSIDVYVRGLSDQAANRRIILLKSFKPFTNESASTSAFTTEITDATNLDSYLSANSTLALYLQETNDLVCTIYTSVNGTTTAISTAPLKNIPLNTPFRITVVVEERTFTLYLNGKQAFQRTAPAPFALPSGNLGKPQAFYSPPASAAVPSRSIFIQNLHIWSRAISVYEVQHANPGLARKEDFDLPPDPTGRCSST
jgi:hypothetical protein